MFKSIIGIFTGTLPAIINKWQDHQAAKDEAKHEVEMAGFDLEKAELTARAQAAANQSALEVNTQKSEAAWDMEAVKQASKSWKDEYFTIILSAPFVIAFVPAYGPKIVSDGFAAIATAPEWYMWFVAAAVSFAFGIRHVFNLVGRKK